MAEDSGREQAVLRWLAVLADPSGQTRFALEPIRSAIEEASRSPAGFHFDLLRKATLANLEEQLDAAGYDVLLFAGHAHSRPALNYTNLFFETSSGTSRAVEGKYFASLIGRHGSLRAVILLAADEASFCFGRAAESIGEAGVKAVVALPPMDASALARVLVNINEAILANASLRSIAMLIREAHPMTNRAEVYERDDWMIDRASAAQRQHLEAPLANSAAVPVGSRSTEIQSRVVEPDNDASKILQQKRMAGHFDVFLCHNSSDKPAVITIANRLKAAGILPWLDIWELPPGKLWQPELERQMPSIRSAAVFVGMAGVGPWQQEEIYGFLQEFVHRQIPVIPVLLPEVQTTPVLPMFLRLMTWVDFRETDSDPFARLIWGITGKRPAD